MPSKEIFLSHSSDNKELADAIVDLLDTGLAVSAEHQVFCSSVAGLGIPPGNNFKDYIKGEIQKPKIVILLISKSYLASQFCLAEVGACWAMSHVVVPILVSPVAFEDMQAVLEGTQAFMLLDRGGWDDVAQIVKSALKVEPNLSRWGAKRDQALLRFANLITKQNLPEQISATQYRELGAKLQACEQHNSNLSRELQRLRHVNQKLSAAKDAEEVNTIQFESLPEKEQLSTLIASVKENFAGIRYITEKALYYQLRNEETPVSGLGHNDLREDVREAEERGEIAILGDVLVPELSNPRVARAEEALQELNEFLITRTANFKERYTSEYDHKPNLRTRDFWDKWLFSN
jgi:hypothetical protein